MNNKTHNVAIIYHYLAHYREAVFVELCKDNSSTTYTIFSDTKSNINSLVTIDTEKAKTSLNWEFIINKWFFKNILWQKGLVNICLSSRFDTIIFLGNAYFISTWVGAIIAKLMRKKVYMWTHGFLRDEKSLTGYIRLKFYQICDGLFVYGNRSKKILVKKGYKKERIHVVYNSLDYENQKDKYKSLDPLSLKSIKEKYFSNSNLPTILWIGRLVPDKRIDLLLHAVKRLCDREINCNLLLIGDGPEKQKLIDLSQSQSISENTYFFGPCHDEVTLAPLITLSDVCVSPGPVGLTALHSMAYGVPVVTNDNFDKQKPEVEAIIPDITGDFYHENDLDDLCNKIEKWISKNNREQISKNCQDVISDCWNPAYQKKVFEKVILGEI